MKRREGLSKLTGRERYVDDLAPEGFLWGATVRSSSPRGVLQEVRFGEEIDWSAFVVVDHRGIPGENHVALMEADQPILASTEVRHVHEPVVLLAHEDRQALRRAVAAVEVVVDPRPPVLDFRLRPRPDQIQHGEDNVFKRILVDKGLASQGDLDDIFASAPVVVEGVYETGSQEHVYLETQGMLAWEEDGVVCVQGSMQCPYYVHRALTVGLGRGDDEVRVIQAATGGGFGGKEEFPSGLALHAALLTLAAGRPVKLVYDRLEDLAVSTKRHPSRVRHRTAVTRDGKLLAQDVEVVLDAGAYVTLSPVVLSRAVLHAAGPYACDHVRIRGKAVLTNAVPFGAFRGFGAPQSLFALERHMDVVARRIGLDPLELRRRNLIREGQSTATGQIIRDGADRHAVLDRALELSDFEERRRRHEAFNGEHPYLRRGMGLATFQHGAGFTGAGEVYLDSVVQVEGRADGVVEVLAASTEMGQGTETVFTQLAAARLGVPPEQVEVVRPDTSRVPNSGPTVASRTAMIVGRLVEKACDDLLAKLGLAGPSTISPLEDPGTSSSSSPEDPGTSGKDPGTSSPEDPGTSGRNRGSSVKSLQEKTLEDPGTSSPEDPGTSGQGSRLAAALAAWHGENPGKRLLGEGRYVPPPGVHWDEETYRGEAYGAYAWAAYVAEVEVDLRTYTARVLDFVAVQEVGKVLNEVLARGQIQGGVVQGLGWALLEDFRWQDGAMVNAQLTNYVIPTSDDVPPIRVAFLEAPYEHGAQGAKGIGELPMDGPAPAVANAVAAALGVEPTAVPLTPEAILELLEPADPAEAALGVAGAAP